MTDVDPRVDLDVVRKRLARAGVQQSSSDNAAWKLVALLADDLEQLRERADDEIAFHEAARDAAVAQAADAQDVILDLHVKLAEAVERAETAEAVLEKIRTSFAFDAALRESQGDTQP